MVVYDLNDFMILYIKGIDYRCYVFNINKNDAITLLNNSMGDNKGVLKWIFFLKFQSNFCEIFVKFM